MARRTKTEPVAPASFALHIRRTDAGHSQLIDTGRRFPDADQAQAHAEQLMERWPTITSWRALESDLPPNCTQDTAPRDAPICGGLT